MSRKLVAVFVGAALMLGVVGVGAAPAGAQLTSSQQTSLSVALNNLLAQVNQYCTANPGASPLCAKASKVTQAQVDALVGRISLAVFQPGRMDAISARIGTAKTQICANKSAIEARIPNLVPVRFQPRALAALTKLCAV
jgi:hypothetical protein